MDPQVQQFLQTLTSQMARQNAELLEETNAKWLDTVNTMQQNFQATTAELSAQVCQVANDRQTEQTNPGFNEDQNRATVIDKHLSGKISPYNGSTDGRVVNGFLNALNLKFAMHNIQEDHRKIMVFGSHLEGAAQVWFAAILDGCHTEESYEDVIRAFKLRFLPVNYARACKEKLMALVQKRSVTEYVNQFTELSAMVESPWNHPTVLLDKFIEGLKDQIKIQLEVSRPASLEEAFATAQRVDSVVWKNSGQSFNVKSRFIRDPDAMDIDELNVNRNSRGCWYCGKPGHISRHCRTKQKDATESKNESA